MDRTDPQPDGGAENILLPPLSILNEDIFASETVDRMPFDCLGGDVPKDSGCCLSIQELTKEISHEERPDLYIADECCDSGHVPHGTSYICSHEEVVHQSHQFLCESESHSLEQGLSPGIATDQVKVSDATDFNLIVSSCGSGIPVDGQNGQSNSDSVANRRRNPKRAASLKSVFSMSKLDRKAGKKHVRASGKIAGGFSKFFWDSVAKATKKRSFRNLTHIHDWGAIEKLDKMFVQSDGDSLQKACAISSIRRPMQAASSSHRKRRESKDKKDAKSSRIKAIELLSSLQLEDGSSSHFPDLMDSSLFPASVPENCLLDNHDYFDAASHHFAVLENSFTPRQSNVPCPDVSHLDKGPDSSVTEVSGENNSSDCPGISSKAIPHSFQDGNGDVLPMYPGTSPESGVINPSVDAGMLLNDAVTSTDKEPPVGVEVIEQNDHVMDNKHLSGTFASVSWPDSSTLQQCNSHKEDAINIEETSGMLQISETHSVELISNDPSLDVSGKVAMCGKHELKTEDESNSLKCYNRKAKKKSMKNVSDQELRTGNMSCAEVKLLCCSEIPQENIGEHNCLRTCAEVGESDCETHSDTENAKMANFLAQNKKERVNYTHKDKKKLPVGMSKVSKEMHASVACKEKDKDLTSRGFSGMQDVCSLNGAGEITGHPALQNECVLEAADGPSGARVDEDKQLAFSGSNAGNVESDLASKDEPKTKNFAGLSLEAPCSEEQVAWVCCDDCSKWRSIPEKLADIIGESKCRWTCKDNNDKMFADCSVPQEKSNSEINAELGIPDEEATYDVNSEFNLASSNPTANKRASWIGIRSNVFLHRSRKKQTIDEIMVCHCKSPSDGSLGCKDECLNRMLNIECVRGTCPCGDLCSNQQFQKRKYTRMKWFQCGKKGYGLKSLENVFEGDFLIEYVGEVLDMTTYEARQREYASRGQEHFYFMTLNGHEVIDACSKGNLGRFINHSCEPNCRTEKWMVKGEVCIGLFAMRDISKGEELTFDYNYVRVVGAAAKKCFCGSPGCRGFIGGDPLNSESIVECDSDEELPRTMMTPKDGVIEAELKQTVPDAFGIDNIVQKRCDQEQDIKSEVEDIPVIVKKHEDNFLSAMDTMGVSVSIKSELENALQSEEVTCTALPDDQPLENSITINVASKSLTEAVVEDKTKFAANTSEQRIGKPKARSSKLPQFAGYHKNLSGARTFTPQKTKKANGYACNRQFEGVEEKLNPLLDSYGGISKRRDSTKGYLKLLVVTAASNNFENETTQSTRDLSLILDALLKTKSRTVLTDIINKNGLQMLHNIMKQNRVNSIKIPILRKLLKVLEFLATKGILTIEQINMDPTCIGVESFRDSIIRLTYHSDIQVHQIARSFRDTWIPRAYRRASQMHRDRYGSESYNDNSGSLLPCKRQTDSSMKNADVTEHVRQRLQISSVPNEGYMGPDMCVSNQKVSDVLEENGQASLSMTKVRKRKTRWDQDKPPDKPRSSSITCNDSGSTAEPSQNPGNDSQKRNHNQICESGLCLNGASASNSFQRDIDDEMPPGFDSPPGFVPSCKRHKDQQVTVDMPATSGVVVGKIQERYLAQLTISHGIPFPLVQQFGMPGDANSNNQCWTIAPGIPFHPFPPLPPYPRGKLNAPPPPSTGPSSSMNHHLLTSGFTDRSHMNGQFISSSQGDPFIPCASGGIRPVVYKACMVDTNDFKRCRRSFPGRFPSRPERGSNRGYCRGGPPWARNNQFRGSLKCGMQGRILENTHRKDGIADDPNDVKGDCIRSTFQQLPKDS